ncbi:MAG: putative Ig domain-containing protein, partial [Bryobacteraceae bacterium]
MQTLVATGGQGPYTWSMTSGALPDGLTFAGNGTISGMATTAGVFGFTVRVQDSALATAGKAFTLTAVTAGTSIITTFAGNGTSDYSGDGGPAAAAQLAGPVALALDGSGNVYIAEQGCCGGQGITPINHRVRKVSPGGTITTVAGNGSPGYSGDGGPAASAQLYFPYGLAADASGNLYIADSGNYRIRKVSASGVITTVAGNGTSGYSGDGGPATSAQLNFPYGLAADASGNLYIADSNNQRIRKVSASGIITTVAGNGTSGYAGDGGPAISAQLNFPYGLAVDTSGNLYIADSSNQRIRKVSASGVITTVAGNGTYGYSGDGGPATSSQLWGPRGVAVDASGSNLYIADEGSHRVRLVLTGAIGLPVVTTSTLPYGAVGMAYSGMLSAIGGTPPYTWSVAGGALSGGLNLTSGGAISGTPYAAGASIFTVRVQDSALATASKTLALTISAAGTSYITTVAGNGTSGSSGDGGLATSAQLSGPAGVAVDGSGNLYVATGGSVRKIAPGGIITTLAVSGSYLYGLAADGAGNLYVADENKNQIFKVSPAGIVTTVAGSGSYGFSGDGGPATSARMSNPSGVVVDGAGNLYIADSGSSAIRKVLPSGIITTVAGGSACYDPTGATLCGPSGLAMDGSGNLYIADTYSNRIRKLAPNGIITTVAGMLASGYSGDGGLATNAQLSRPEGVAIDGSGNLYIADTQNNRIRKVSAAGIITTVAGSGIRGYFGDGGPATGAQLSSPVGVALDASGNLFVSDRANSSVRVILAGTPALNISTASQMAQSTVGVAYSQTLTANGGTPPYAWSVTSGTLPAGLTLSTGGVISGTPTTYGTSTFGISVTDAGGFTASQSFSLTVNPAPLVISTAAPLPSGVAGTAYSQALAAAGGVPPYRWLVSSGTLPPLLTLSADGVITGVPATPGVSVFTISVTDAASHTASQAFALTITLGPLAITTAATLPAGVVGASYSQTLAATGGIPPYAWQVKSGAWPPGLIFSSGGALTGAPSQVGSFGFTVQVTDSSAASASRVFSLLVSAPGCASSLNYSGQAFSAAGGSGTVTVAAPAGCQWTASSQLSWVAITAGASGTGNGAVAFQVAANSGAARSGAIAIAGFPFTVEQSAASLAGLSTIGSIAQATSGGGWKSTLTLINTGSTTEDALVSFFDDYGNPLALPVNYPQAPLAAPALASVIDRTVDPGAELLIETAGP